MISALKPYPGTRPRLVPKRLPSAKVKSMTIAIGMLCGGGAIIAADMQGYRGDGMAQRISKIESFHGKGMVFSIAYSSDDADSARRLVREIGATVGSIEVSGWKTIETAVSDAMLLWREAFNPEPIPATSLIVAFYLTGHGLRLYSCELPNNVLYEQSGYVAVGLGSAVTSPLAATLFDPFPQSRPTQMVLRQVAYLMYRAKKDNYYCKGGTDAMFVSDDGKLLKRISALDFQAAERVSGQLDQIFNIAATATLGGNGEFLEHNARSVGEAVLMYNEIRETVFHDTAGNVLGPQLPLPGDPL